MSWLSKAGLLLAGAAAGYVASKRGGQIVHTAQELVVRDPMQVSKRDGGEGTVDKIWSSPALTPVRNGALKALKFAATVKQGMAEREEQLTEKYANQKKDIRPGSLDTWDRPRTAEAESRSGEALPGEQGSSEVIEHSAPEASGSPARDSDLPPDFFLDSGNDPQNSR
ncbi:MULTISPECIES: hypothetical protein [Micrococcaceae]|uniref:hypothetical protein n=1 Tax=unclassified Kocuria TaxID=2649579 RepID=UPI0010110828|nr:MULTISPECIES: hypothetical protein [unclassified Kocuria]